MRILVADETNNEPSDNVKFFLYGGVIFDSESVKKVGDSIRSLRNEFDMGETEKLKFNLRSCPKALTKEQHTEMKNRIIDIATKYKVSVIINCVLHDIAKNKSKNKLVEMTSATVFRRFNQYCKENDAPGLVLADQWPCDNGFGFLESCQQEGIQYKLGEKVSLPMIYGYAQISDNSTTLMSVADIILGAFRYCINERNKTIVNTTLMPKIARLMWYTNENGNRKLRNRGLNISPREIQVQKYKKEYDALIDHIVKYANKS